MVALRSLGPLARPLLGTCWVAEVDDENAVGLDDPEPHLPEDPDPVSPGRVLDLLLRSVRSSEPL